MTIIKDHPDFQSQNLSLNTKELTEGANLSPIDLDHLSKQTFGDKELASEVLGLFLSHSRKTIELMKSAQTEKEWGEAMHAIKGSARTIGAWNIGDLAEHYEQNSLPNDEAAFERQKQAAATEIENLLEVVNTYILKRS